MADRTTHSHDTSTPAMSAETVPSEEAAKLVYEAMVWARDQQPGVPVPKWIDGGNSDAQYEARRVIRKIADLSASHLAKEGGEAGAVKAAYRKGVLDACELVGPPDDMADKELTEHGRLKRDAMHYARRELLKPLSVARAVASLPQPSPALAKGGDAVLEWETCKPLVGNYAERAPTDFGDFRVERHTGSEQIQLSGPGLDMRWGEGLESGKAAVEEYFVGIIRGYASLLSTPTEGPASQTEGMGGDALRKVVWEAIKTYMKESHEHGGSHGIALDEAVKSAEAELATLTPPETAEAVSVAADRLRDLEGAQAVLDGHHAEFGETPSMTGSRARIAERKLADAVKALETARKGWRNDCAKTVPEALRFLANNDRPIGGEQRFNAWHLFQLADEIEFAARSASSQGGE